MRILLLSAAPCVYEARPRFAATQLAALGHEVVLLCRAAPDAPASEDLGEARLIRVDFDDWSAANSTKALGRLGKFGVRSLTLCRRLCQRLGFVGANRMLALVQEFWSLAGHGDALVRDHWSGKVDVIHASGLPALPNAGRVARRYHAKLIYDSIELERDRNANYFPLFHWLRLRLERHWIRNADGIAAVSEEIALQLQRDYAIPLPETIYNIGPPSIAEPGLRQAIGLDAATPLAVYVGAIARNRGLVEAIEAIGQTQDMHLAVVGPRTSEFAARYSDIVAAAGAEGRVRPALPRSPGQAAGFVADADVALAMGAPSCASYDFALPNKLFQTVTAGLPVLVGRTRALRRVVAATGVGEGVDDRCAKSVAAAAVRQAKRRRRPEYRAARAVFLLRYGSTIATASWARLYARAVAVQRREIT